MLSAAGIVAMIFYLGAQPFAAHLIPVPWDKLAHLLVFGTITGLLWVGSAGRWPLLVFACVSLIGVLDEWHQAGLPGRSMDLADLLTDMIAAVLTITLLQALKNRSTR